MSACPGETSGRGSHAAAEGFAAEVILHSQYPWSEIGRRLGLPKHQAISRFRRLLVTAGIHDHGEVGET
jgi:hypothetical protein